jgi:hypothetical protein
LIQEEATILDLSAVPLAAVLPLPEPLMVAQPLS